MITYCDEKFYNRNKFELRIKTRILRSENIHEDAWNTPHWLLQFLILLSSFKLIM